MQQLQNVIEFVFECCVDIMLVNVDIVICEVVNQVIVFFDFGVLCVVEKIDGQWVMYQWLKKVVLFFFCINDNQVIDGVESCYFDKVLMKFVDYDEVCFQKEGFCVVLLVVVCQGVFIVCNIVLMLFYVNIGVYVDEGIMVDIWVIVGFCVQIGKNVYLFGGVGIGGVLELLQVNLIIIEDNCFIGVCFEVVEGVIVEEGFVIFMGVYFGQSIKIYDCEIGEVFYGCVLVGLVVVLGNLLLKDGKYSLYCVVIVKKVDVKICGKVGINELLCIID